MEFQDKVLKCIDCGSDFIFTAGEQLFFHDKQFKNEPKRCKGCKAKRISVLGATVPGPGARQNGDPDHLFPVRQGDHRSLQAHTRETGLLPGMFPAEAAASRNRLSARVDSGR